MTAKGRITQFRYATISELFEFHEKGLHGIEWGIKGHNRPWIINQEFKKGTRVLDIGGGYSDTANYLAEKFGVEAWIAEMHGLRISLPRRAEDKPNRAALAERYMLFKSA